MADSLVSVSAVALDEARLHRQLVRSQAHGFTRLGRGDAFHLEQDLARTDDGDPVIGSSLALAHTGFGWLLGDRLVGKEAQPDFSAALDEAGHGDTAGFNLAVGDVAALHDLQSVIAEGQLTAAPGLAGHAPALLLAVFHFLGHQHKSALKSSRADG